MFEPEKRLEEIRAMAHGAPQLAAYQSAFQEADEAGAHDWRFFFRYKYLEESIFHDDCFKAIICFPEMLQIFDEHPEIQDENESDLMTAFKWVIENMIHYHQISREEIERLFAEYRRRCEKYGYTLRTYYMKLSKYLSHVDHDEAMKAYDQFHRARRGPGCDCQACEMNYDMEFALEMGDTESALRIAAPILEKKMRCAEVPHCSYGELAHHYLYKGDLDEAFYYGDLCKRLIEGKPEFLGTMGYLLELYSTRDSIEGWRLMKETLPFFFASHDPLDRMTFARGMWRLLTIIASQDEEGCTQNVDLCRLPLPKDERGVKLADCAQWAYTFAEEQSRLLDERNGTSYYADFLKAELPQETQEAVSYNETGNSIHGIVRRIPAVQIICHAEGQRPTFDEMCARLEKIELDGAEMVNYGADGEMIYATWSVNGVYSEMRLQGVDLSQAPLEARPLGTLTQETLDEMIGVGDQLMFHLFLGSRFMTDYYVMMQMIACMCPDLVCVIDPVTGHALPDTWVKFNSRFAEASAPDDFFGLHFFGDSKTGRIGCGTMGLRTLGMREMMFLESDEAHYERFGDMLNNASMQLVMKGMMPDMGEPFAECGVEGEVWSLTWMQTEDGCRLVVKTDDGDVPVETFAPFVEAEEIRYPRPQGTFDRDMRLAKATFPKFVELLAEPHEDALVRVEFPVEEQVADDFDYGIELLWCRVTGVEGDAVTAVTLETSDATPSTAEGDIVTVTQDRAVSWSIDYEDGRRMNSRGVWMLWEEDGE